MKLFYTLLHATLLTTHLWAAAAAGGEGAESDDFLTKNTPKAINFSRVMDKLDLTQAHKKHIKEQITLALRSSDSLAALIELLPKGAGKALDREMLQKKSLMFFSVPVVASPTWDALTEAEKAQRYLDHLTLEAIIPYCENLL